MKVIDTLAEMKKIRRELNSSVGFVPTMGYLHEGHLSLVMNAKKDCRTTVVSIFVNPAQFLPNEDFTRYPRDPDRDFKKLEKLGTEIVFMPTPSDIYPENFNTWVNVDGITDRLEGASRPGHFRGVATIVNKLFNIVEPDNAYFGQKDAQQCAVIKKMVTDLNMNVRVIIIPTIREPDGLAMSSRNIYLNPEERLQATVLNRSLIMAKGLYEKGENDPGKIIKQMVNLIQKQPLANIDYVDIADAEMLTNLKEMKKPALISLAVKFGKTRLIDNILLE